MPPAGGNMRGAMRSVMRDSSVTEQMLPKGMFRRILKFAKPYTGLLLIFLVLITVDAVIGVANRLIFRAIIDRGILRHNSGLIVKLALLVGGLAIVDAGLSISETFL